MEQVADTISKEIDKLNDWERKFALWYLLKEYIAILESETKEYHECKDKTELATEIMRASHIKAGNEMIDCLGFDLW
jgi:hypothetical protein